MSVEKGSINRNRMSHDVSPMGEIVIVKRVKLFSPVSHKVPERSSRRYSPCLLVSQLPIR